MKYIGSPKGKNISKMVGYIEQNFPTFSRIIYRKKLSIGHRMTFNLENWMSKFVGLKGEKNKDRSHNDLKAES